MRYIILLAMFVAGCATQEVPVVKDSDGSWLREHYDGPRRRQQEADLKDRQLLQVLLQDAPCFDGDHAIRLHTGKWVCVEDLRWKGSVEKQREMREYEKQIPKLEAQLKAIQESDHSEESGGQETRRLLDTMELTDKLIKKRQYLEILREKAYPGYAARMEAIGAAQSRIFRREQIQREVDARLYGEDGGSYLGGGGGGCGSRGGPGIRGANGKCKSWKSLGR